MHIRTTALALQPKTGRRIGVTKKLAATLCCCAVIGGAAFASTAHAAVLLTINDSNPAAVTFTATGNAPSANDSSHYYSDGIDLAGFFGTNPALGLFPAITATSTSLATGVDGTPNYTGAQSGSYSGSATSDLTLYAGSGNFQNFNTSTSAFTGTATFDFSASSFYADGILPSAGSTGALYAGTGALFRAAPVQIGSYQIVNSGSSVPEPASLSLLGLGALGLLARRRQAR